MYLLGMVLALAVFATATVWWLSAHYAYMRHYQSAKNPTAQPPRRWFTESPVETLEAWRVMWRRQSDPDLERSRRKSVRRWLLIIATMPLIWVLPLILTML